MIAYIIETQNQNLLIFISLKSTNLIKVANLYYVYILIIQGTGKSRKNSSHFSGHI